MCGICAYIGVNNSFDYVYNGILSLLNRGYDSIGISTLNIDMCSFITDKYATDESDKKIFQNKENHKGNISIGHCRWATSGLKTDNNSHPHQDIYNLFSLIHNGTIDNYNEIKDFLINEDSRFIFKSETDTEVIVNLISYYYNKLNDDKYISREKNINISDIVVTSIELAVKHFNENSTYTLVIICINTPNILYCLRSGTPLLIGYNENKSMTMVVSEKYGFNNNIKKYAPIYNNDIIVIEYISNTSDSKCKIGVYSLFNDLMIENYINYLNNKKYNNDTNINNSFVKNINFEISNYIFTKLLNNTKIHKKLSSFKKRYKYDMLLLNNESTIESINNRILLNNIDLNKTIEPINTRYDINEYSKRNNFDYNKLKETWTFKEIIEQPVSLRNTICNGKRIYKDDSIKLGGLDNHKDILLEITDLILLGCGSSYNSALIASKYFKELCVFNTVQTFDGSEFTLNDIPKSVVSKIGIIFITQSGETKDLYDCLKDCNKYNNNINNKNNIITIGVVNVIDSMIARETLCGVYLNCGKENAVASTKSITSQIIALALIALWFSQYQSSSLTLMNEMLRVKYINDIKKLPDQIEELLKVNMCVSNISNDIQYEVTDLSVSSLYKHDYNKLLTIFNSIRGDDNNRQDTCFIIDKTYAVSLEGALKFKELSYIMAEGKTGSSLKHGPFSILKKDFPVIIINNFNNNNKNEYLKMNTIIEEIKSREATIIKITDLNINLDNNELVFLIPKNECFSDIISIIVLQLMSVFLSVERNNNIDKPRHLAKTVTV